MDIILQKKHEIVKYYIVVMHHLLATYLSKSKGVSSLFLQAKPTMQSFILPGSGAASQIFSLNSSFSADVRFSSVCAVILSLVDLKTVHDRSWRWCFVQPETKEAIVAKSAHSSIMSCIFVPVVVSTALVLHRLVVVTNRY
jgi:hypothetical protein